MQYEINKEIVFSSCHITEQDDYRLSNLLFMSLSIYEYEYGHRIYVGVENLVDGDEKILLSDSFWNLYQIAIDNDCKWLLIDCDGQVFDHLQKFDW